MQSTWQWFTDSPALQILLAIFVAVFIGVALMRYFRSFRDKSGRAAEAGDKSFFKGIQFLLSDDRDQAIEEFTKSVQVNSNTIETYVALGNLYRSKGDIDRAIRIRQNIILRPNIDERIKVRALLDLGKDYRKGGFLNRALKTFIQVTQKRPNDLEAFVEVERIYEELKDWDNAYVTRQKIARISRKDFSHILAHYLVENGKICQTEGDLNRAKVFFGKAISTHKGCVDAYLHLGDLFFAREEYEKAISTWKKVVAIAPQFTFLAYRRLEGAYSRMKNLKPVEDFLKECAKSNQDAFTHMALARYLYNENDVNGALKEAENALELDPTFWEARRFKGEILVSHGKEKEIVADYVEILSLLNMPYLRFQCSQCGFEPDDLQWRCPQCNMWDTIGLVDSPSAVVENKE